MVSLPHPRLASGKASPHLRRAAIALLGRVPPASEAAGQAEAILLALHAAARDAKEKDRIILALTQFPGARTWETLARAAFDSDDAQVRTQAIGALKRMPGTSGADTAVRVTRLRRRPRA